MHEMAGQMVRGKEKKRKRQPVFKKIRNRFGRDEKFRLYIEYSAFFLIFAIAVFSPFAVYGKAFLWGSDGMSQHYPTLLYTKKWVKELLTEIFVHHRLRVPYWDLTLGFGQDVMNSALNFRLFNFLFVFFPNSAVEAFLVFRTVGSLYFCGIAFLSFARRRTSEHGPLLIGTMMYLFSGFSIYFAARHPFFLEMMFYMPLLMVGVEDIFRKKSSKLFVLIVFLSGISYFYFLYMVTLPTVIYAFFLFFEQEKERKTVSQFLQVFIRCVLHYAVGLMLSAFSLYPSLVRTLHSSRMGNKSTSRIFFWDADFYTNFFRGIIGMEEIGIYGFIALSGIAFLLIVYAVFLRKGKYQGYIRQLLLYTIVFLVPVLVMIFSGFSGKTQRWCFVLSFWAAVCVTAAYPEIRQIRQAAWVRALLAVSVYLVIYVLLSYRSGETIPLSVLLIFPSAALLMFIGSSPLVRRHRKMEILIVLAVLCLDVTLKSYELYAPNAGNYIDQFADAGKLTAEGKDNPFGALALAEDDSVFRTDVVTSPRSQKYNQMNYGLRNGLAGISSYYSFSDDRICRYSLDLGNSQQNITFLTLDFDQRTVLNELAGVKYLTVFKENRDRMPYGYEKVGKQEKRLSNGNRSWEYLYENIYALPLIYSYDSWFSKEEYEQLPTNRKEQSMLQGAVLEQEIAYPHTQLSFDDQILLDKEEILRQLRELDTESHIEVYDDHLVVKSNGYRATLYLDPAEADRVAAKSEIDEEENAEEQEIAEDEENSEDGMIVEEEEEPEEDTTEGELAFVMKNASFISAHYLDSYYSWMKQDPYTSKYRLRKVREKINSWKPVSATSVTAKCGSFSDTAAVLNETHQYYFGSRDLLLNMGYAAEGSTLQISFSASGEYYFDDLFLAKQTMDGYEDKVEALRHVVGEEITVDTNEIRATIETPQERLMCIAVPYSAGWKAYVNGQKTEVMPCNGMYMAVMVPAGTNELRLEYTPPGQKTGNRITLLTLAGCILGYAAYRCLRERQRV